MPPWVIAYDVHENRRRAKIARRLERAGLRVQKSVFVVDASHAQLRKLMAELGSLLDPRTDQLAAWRLTEPSDSNRAATGLSAGPLYQETIVW